MSDYLHASLTTSAYNTVQARLQEALIQRIYAKIQGAIAERQQPPLAGGAVNGHLRQDIEPSAFDHLIQDAARRHGVDEDLVRAVIKVESNFNPEAVSYAGAKGLMQLMDATAADLGVTNSFDVAQNIEGGVSYLAQQLRRFQGDTRLALAAYNAGPGAVQRYQGVPPFDETQRYIQRVMTYYNPEPLHDYHA
jgi:soluble lytic murein transglycosylase-like protein